MIVIKTVFFHDFAFVPGDGFGGDFVEGGNFNDIKAIDDAGGDGSLRFGEHFMRAMGADERGVASLRVGRNFAPF